MWMCSSFAFASAFVPVCLLEQSDPRSIGCSLAWYHRIWNANSTRQVIQTIILLWWEVHHEDLCGCVLSSHFQYASAFAPVCLLEQDRSVALLRGSYHRNWNTKCNKTGHQEHNSLVMGSPSCWGSSRALNTIDRRRSLVTNRWDTPRGGPRLWHNM